MARVSLFPRLQRGNLRRYKTRDKMAQDDEAIVCGTDGCATPAPMRTEPVVAAAAGALELSVVSDAICPWCYVGKRRLEQAISLMDGVQPVRVAWRPFELNPQM